MESIFLILSGVIFMAGILYWFWSHIQLTQKKVLLLENAVFELRSQLTRLPEASGPPAYKTAYADLADDWEEDASGTPIETVEASNIPDDLRPGGHASHDQDIIDNSSPPADMSPQKEEESNTQFRELFVNENAVKSIQTPISATPESLDSMSLKELRRLADQRGIPNSNDLRKKEILSALRNQITLPVNELNVVQLQESDAVSVNEILE